MVPFRLTNYHVLYPDGERRLLCASPAAIGQGVYLQFGGSIYYLQSPRDALVEFLNVDGKFGDGVKVLSAQSLCRNSETELLLLLPFVISLVRKGQVLWTASSNVIALSIAGDFLAAETQDGVYTPDTHDLRQPITLGPRVNTNRVLMATDPHGNIYTYMPGMLLKQGPSTNSTNSTNSTIPGNSRESPHVVLPNTEACWHASYVPTLQSTVALVGKERRTLIDLAGGNTEGSHTDMHSQRRHPVVYRC